ncbi:propanediol utilization protein PduL [Klebsiella pneumoniae]|uniref:Phosphate propanoyltransferase n=1 Tax=Klebsiella pneumoniae TaxID=573 RepID=A0A4P0YF36_KLEPN|nr:propanediol utilization protein PduL [Klebsiella pneumoniae]
MDKQQLASTVNKVLDEMRQRPIPIGISSRHIHLAAADYARLFPAQPIQPKKALLQPGQYAAEQTVTLVGPKGRLNNVRLLGPLRQTSQVESHATRRPDPRYRRAAAHVRQSAGHAGIRLISPFAELELSGGTIVAQRHIHMSPLDALILRVSHGDSVAVAIEGSDRRLIFDNVAVRVAPDMRLEMHIDTDEANAAGADAAKAWATLVTKP